MTQLSQGQQNRLAHMLIEVYYWGIGEAFKTVRKAISDMEDDKQTDSEDYRDLKAQEELYEVYGEQLDAMATELLDVIARAYNGFADLATPSQPVSAKELPKD